MEDMSCIEFNLRVRIYISGLVLMGLHRCHHRSRVGGRTVQQQWMESRGGNCQT